MHMTATQHEGVFVNQDKNMVGVHPKFRLAVQPNWCLDLPMQQQSVLLLAGRGPDGVAKHHPCKPVHTAYRACVFVAAKYGRSITYGERGDSFMSLDVFADNTAWSGAVDDFFRHHDGLPLHYLKHLMHGVEILGYKHPHHLTRTRWNSFYLQLVAEMHLNVESEAEMDDRLNDWNREDW